MLRSLEKCPEGGEPFDPFLVPEDWARLQYGRMLWKNPETRQRLLRHWTDMRHPYRERFLGRYRPWVEMLLESEPGNDEALDARLQEEGHSLHTLMREIPPSSEASIEQTSLPARDSEGLWRSHRKKG